MKRCNLINIHFMSLQSWGGMGFLAIRNMSVFFLFNISTILIFLENIGWIPDRFFLYVLISCLADIVYYQILEIIFKESHIKRLERLYRLIPRRKRIIWNLYVAIYEVLSIVSGIFAFIYLSKVDWVIPACF